LAACDGAASFWLDVSVGRLVLAFALSSQQMDIVKMLAALRQEREQIDKAIAVLQRIIYGRGKRRGRPP